MIYWHDGAGEDNQFCDLLYDWSILWKSCTHTPGVQKLKNMDPKDFPKFLQLSSKYTHSFGMHV